MVNGCHIFHCLLSTTHKNITPDSGMSILLVTPFLIAECLKIRQWCGVMMLLRCSVWANKGIVEEGFCCDDIKKIFRLLLIYDMKFTAPGVYFLQGHVKHGALILGPSLRLFAHLMSMFRRIVKSQCSPFSTARKTNKMIKRWWTHEEKLIPVAVFHHFK